MYEKSKKSILTINIEKFKLVYKKQVNIKTGLLGAFLLICISAFSQQNFINVPSSEVTTKKKIFFQQQLNFNKLIQSKYHIGFWFRRWF
jgi:c-di-AMP phosphodiesterase-like protein